MSRLHLGIFLRRENDGAAVVLEGHLDAATASTAEVTLRRYLDELGPRLVLDMRRLHFIDSRGLGTLIALAREARARGGEVALAEPTLPVRNILAITRTEALFPVVDLHAPAPVGTADGRATAAKQAPRARRSGVTARSD
ncbi:MAG: STAS domain-containing protein [Armatimonadetes bacterium]|nr:STAS domain-containing protein [Armatimonadota bacterium]